MKKATKIALIVAGAMVVLGGVVCAVIGILGVGGRLALPERVSAASTYQDQTLPIAADGSVRIHVMTDDVIIGVSPDADAHLQYYDTAFVQNVIVADADRIDLTQEVVSQTRWPDLLRWVAEWAAPTDVTLLLPKGFSGELIVTATTGDITAKSLDVTLLSLDCTTGNITVTGADAGTMALGASTGWIALTDASVDGDLTVITTTGDASLTNVTADAIERRASTGATAISGVKTGFVFVNASTGELVLTRLDTDKLTVALTTGSVRGTLVGTAAEYADALDIRTTTGEIALRYVDE